MEITTVKPKCGDGLLRGSEICDDGGNGRCNPTCMGPETGYSCDTSEPTICEPICGDGLVMNVIDTELCDDGIIGALSLC